MRMQSFRLNEGDVMASTVHVSRRSNAASGNMPKGTHCTKGSPRALTMLMRDTTSSPDPPRACCTHCSRSARDLCCCRGGKGFCLFSQRGISLLLFSASKVISSVFCSCSCCSCGDNRAESAAVGEEGGEDGKILLAGVEALNHATPKSFWLLRPNP